MTPCTVGFCKLDYYNCIMKADLRIFVNDYHRNKNLKVALARAACEPLDSPARFQIFRSAVCLKPQRVNCGMKSERFQRGPAWQSAARLEFRL